MEYARALTLLVAFGVRICRTPAQVSLVLCLLQAGCATQTATSPMLDHVAIERPGTRPTYVEATHEQAARGIVITRGSRRIPVMVPMPLETGDEIRVEPPYVATITFPGDHEATLMPDTRARLGSILELIGRAFVSAKGYFKVETQYVTAGVKGTEFWVRVTPDQIASAGVISGTITVSPKAGRWNPVDVARDEVVTMRRDAPPTKELKQRAELDAIWQTMRRVRTLFPPVRRPAAPLVPRLPPTSPSPK